MSLYRGKNLVVRRDRTVVFDGVVIGTVYPDPADTRVQQRDWCYAHVTGTTLQDLHPDWRGPRTAQTALTKRDAAEGLADLHRAIDKKPSAAAGNHESNGPVPAGTRRYAWTVQGESHYPHSNPEWRSEEASGVIQVREGLADAGDALVTIITGHGEGATEESTIPWDLFSLEHAVSITFGPADELECSGA